ncbi:unnamed protein product [Meganyctiphanes norvegica]|uniref:Uncharacterized protein n=1 Tax=Meganyctiphanes norvegica TaxID=48144 RepID=A0AAV2Q6Y7_MEGNR
MAPFLLLLLGLTAKRGCASSSQDNISEEAVPALAASPNKKVYGWGDSCEDECSEESNTVCEKSTKTCECASDHPVVIHNKFCVKPVLLGNRCIHADQCVYHDAHAICREYSENYTTCVCSDQYVVKSLEGLHLPKLCFPNLSALQPDVPTLLGLGLGMSVFSLLICLVLKIFARARFVRPRGYADAHINPPLTVSETYAAYALAAQRSHTSSPAGHLPRRSSSRTSITSRSSLPSSRRASYTQRPSKLLLIYNNG